MEKATHFLDDNALMQVLLTFLNKTVIMSTFHVRKRILPDANTGEAQGGNMSKV